MNPLVEIASGILYLAFRICTIPGVLALYIFMGLWIVLKHTVHLHKKLHKYFVALRRQLHQPSKRNAESLLPRWIRFQ